MSSVTVGAPRDAKEAAWSLHLENVELRAQVDELRVEIRRAKSRIATLEKANGRLRSDLYMARTLNAAAGRRARVLA